MSYSPPQIVRPTIAGAAVLAVAWALSGAESVTSAAETGFAERLSLALMVVSAGASMLCLGMQGVVRHAYVPLFLFLLAEREAEHGLAFVDAQALDPAFWTSAPWGPQTLASFALVLAVGWSLGALAWNGPAAIARTWRQRPDRVLTVLIAGSVAVLAQIAEDVGDGQVVWLVTEELLELGFAGLLARVVVGASEPGRAESDRPVTRGDPAGQYRRGSAG